MQNSWPDEQAFHTADPRRRQSGEIDFGATWREQGSADAWRVAWLRDTGELYRCRADAYDGSCSDVTVLAVLAEDAVEQVLDGWREAREGDDGLGWLGERMRLLAAA